MADNKGFSLIELIIAISISVVVLAIVASFLWQSSNYYRRSNEDITLQMEAQTILNQLKDLIAEADCVAFDNSTEPAILRIQQGEGLLYEISFDSTGETLYFIKTIKEADESISRTSPQLFFSFLKCFHVSDTDDDESFIKLSFTLQGDYSKYEVKESLIKLRNRIKAMKSYW